MSDIPKTDSEGDTGCRNTRMQVRVFYFDSNSFVSKKKNVTNNKKNLPVIFRLCVVVVELPGNNEWS